MTSWPSMTVIGQVSFPTLGQLKCSRAPTLPPHARGLVLRPIICCAFVWHRLHQIIPAWHIVMEKSYTWGHSINHNFCDLQLKSLDANQPQLDSTQNSSYFSLSFRHWDCTANGWELRGLSLQFNIQSRLAIFSKWSTIHIIYGVLRRSFWVGGRG